MKKLLFFCCVCCMGLFVKAQKVYFMYLQSEGSTPFYVKMGDKVFSSSPEGYLILPQLKDSTYSFILGQPGRSGELQFSININKGDKGFLIKNLDNSYVLLNLQNASVTKPIVINKPTSGTIAKTDHFTKLLAKAADDSTLLYKLVFAEPEKIQPKENKEKVVEQKETIVQAETPVVNEPTPANTTAVVQTAKTDTIKQYPAKEEVSPEGIVVEKTLQKQESENIASQRAETIVEEVKQEAEYKRSVVERKSESSTSEGFGLVFLDKYEGGTDTVRILIPNPKLIFRDTTAQGATEKKDFLDISNQSSDTATQSAVEKTAELTAEPRKPVCNLLADDDDFFKLRRDMAAQKDDEAMIAEAKRYFKTKCYKTDFIKYLSTLFLTDAAKYQFFDAAFMHVSDQDKFALLQTELKDPYYINRFKALIAK